MLYQKNAQQIENIAVSVEDRAFMYGDGCFTTARYSDGKIQLWALHLARFKHAIQVLALSCSLERIETEAQIFIKQLQQYSYGTIKIVISRGVSARGYALPQNDCDLYFYFYLADKIEQPTKIAQIGLLNDGLSTLSPRLKGVKTLNRLEQVMLKATAQQQHWSEALCFDLNGELVEAISSNCFVYLNRVWVTPDLALTGIAGTMRKEILRRLELYQIKHQVRMITQAELAQAQAVFLCNALQPMQMVQQLVDYHGITQNLQLEPCQQLFKHLSLHQLV